MNGAWKPDGPEETVLLTEHYKHEQEMKPFSAHPTQTSSQGSAALLSGTVNQGHGPRQQQEIQKVFKTMEMAEVWVLGLPRSPVSSTTNVAENRWAQLHWTSEAWRVFFPDFRPLGSAISRNTVR